MSNRRLGIAIFLSACLALISQPATAQDYSYARVVRLSLVDGSVQVLRPEAEGWEDGLVNLPIRQGYTISTAYGRAEIEFESRATARLAEHSTLEFTELALAGGDQIVAAAHHVLRVVLVVAWLREVADLGVGDVSVVQATHVDRPQTREVGNLARGADGEDTVARLISEKPSERDPAVISVEAVAEVRIREARYNRPRREHDRQVAERPALRFPEQPEYREGPQRVERAQKTFAEVIASHEEEVRHQGQREEAGEGNRPTSACATAQGGDRHECGRHEEGQEARQGERNQLGRGGLAPGAVTNIWIPDGYKDLPFDRSTPRRLLSDALDAILAEQISPRYNLDAVEPKLFGIGSECYVVGSHEFYLGYAVSRKKLLTLDTGHFHPTETVSDKISAVLAWVPELLLHVSRGVRWDSDHVVILDDAVRAVAEAIVRADALSRVHIALDFFDGSVTRPGALVLGARSVLRALLVALLEPARSREACPE